MTSPARWLAVTALLLPAAARAAAPEARPVELICGPMIADPARFTRGADASLTLAEAKELGFPALDHRWSLEELRRAGPLLARIAGESPARLPRAGSSRSGELFARLVEAGPATAPPSAGRSVDEQFQEAGDWFQASVPPLAVYTDQATAGGPFLREAAELNASSLRRGAALLDLTVPFLARFPPSDPSRAVREQGAQKVRSGMLGMMTGGLQLLELDRAAATPEGLARAWGLLQASLLEIWPRLEPAHRAILVAELERLAAQEQADSPIRAGLAAAAGKLRARAGEEGFTVGPLPSVLAVRPLMGPPWRRCGVPGGGAEAEIPGLGAGLVLDDAAQPGAPTSVGTLVAVDAAGTAYRALRFEGGRQFSSLEERARSFEQSVSGKVERRQVKAGTAVAWEVLAGGPQKRAAVRLFDVAGVHFMAVVEYDATLEPLVRARVRRFLDSFVPAAAAPGATPAPR